MRFWGVTRLIFVFKFHFLFDTVGYCWTIFFCYCGGEERHIQKSNLQTFFRVGLGVGPIILVKFFDGNGDA